MQIFLAFILTGIQNLTKYGILIELSTLLFIDIVRKILLTINLFSYDNSADSLINCRSFR